MLQKWNNALAEGVEPYTAQEMSMGGIDLAKLFPTVREMVDGQLQ